MNFDVEHLQTLLAVVDAGSFDDASIDLGVTASAVSQRIKALENRVGSVLLVRSRPVVPTAQGEAVLRYARQITALSDEYAQSIGQQNRVRLSIGVNADSLATWFTPMLEQLARWPEVSCEILRTDENRALDLLRSGRASAVITNEAEPAQGCTVRLLGTMRYRAAASAAFKAEHLASGNLSGFERLPMMIFDREDTLQDQMLDRLGIPKFCGRATYVPDSWQFVRAIQAGVGWGMIPEQQLESVADLQILDPSWYIDVPLYLQRWSVDTEILRRLEASFVEVAHRAGLDLLT